LDLSKRLVKCSGISQLEKGEVVSYAEEVCSKVEPIGIPKVEVAEQGGQENGKREIPENLTNLFDKSKGELNGQEQTQLSELLEPEPMPTQTLMAGSPPHSTFSLIGPLLLPQTPMGYA
jgi:hypothetical protein